MSESPTKEEEVKLKEYPSHNQSSMLVREGTTYVEPIWIHSPHEKREELKAYIFNCKFNNILGQKDIAFMEPLA